MGGRGGLGGGCEGVGGGVVGVCGGGCVGGVVWVIAARPWHHRGCGHMGGGAKGGGVVWGWGVDWVVGAVEGIVIFALSSVWNPQQWFNWAHEQHRPVHSDPG